MDLTRGISFRQPATGQRGAIERVKAVSTDAADLVEQAGAGDDGSWSGLERRSVVELVRRGQQPDPDAAPPADLLAGVGAVLIWGTGNLYGRVFKVDGTGPDGPPLSGTIMDEQGPDESWESWGRQAFLMDPHARWDRWADGAERFPGEQAIGYQQAFGRLWIPTGKKSGSLVTGVGTSYGTKLLYFSALATKPESSDGLLDDDGVPLIYDVRVFRTLSHLMAQRPTRWRVTVDDKSEDPFDHPWGKVRAASYEAYNRLATDLARATGLLRSDIEYLLFQAAPAISRHDAAGEPAPVPGVGDDEPEAKQLEQQKSADGPLSADVALQHLHEIAEGVDVDVTTRWNADRYADGVI